MKRLARFKYQFDQGQGFLAVANFAFVVLAASDKIATVVHIPAKITVCVLVPLAMVLVWALGWFLDRKKFTDAYQDEANRRNATMVHLGKDRV
jgi:hypothetical protein